MNAAARRTGWALALQLAALGTLGLALAGWPVLDPRGQPQVLVLVDRSQSMPGPMVDRALADVADAARAAGAAAPQVLAFAGRVVQAPGPGAAPDATTLDPAATDIEAALQAALALHARSPQDAVLLLTDGHANRGDTERGLHAARAAGMPLHLRALGRPPPAARLAEVLAPAQAQVGQPLHIGVQVAVSAESGVAGSPAGPALRVTATTRSAAGAMRSTHVDSAGAGLVALTLDGGAGGPLVVDLTLEDPARGQILDSLTDAAVIDVTPRAAVLVVQGSAGPLAASLERGGWTVDRVPATRLDGLADALAGYQAVVLDDVAVSDAGPRLWSALGAAVRERGVGLVVLGGERSFARGGYRDSALEALLPLRAEPQALDETAAVLFAVDKSGSMGQGSGGVDRFRLAQQAVLETARSLGDRDGLGLLVFDVEPRWLVPYGPAPAGTAAMARGWPASPQGGTRLAPALDAALAQLEGVSTARRLLVLVTDGFVDEAPLAALRPRLQAARVELVALAVGPDADVAALQRVVGDDGGLVLRVDQAAELPQAMRNGVERQRARVARGRIAVEQTQALPFAPGRVPDWPPVVAHAVTRPQPEAVVGLQSHRGEPLIAWRQAGRGRVVAVTSGLGAWAAPWLGWREWPRLAGGMIDWASAGAAAQAPGLRVVDLPDALEVEVEWPAGLPAPEAGMVAIEVDGPSARGLQLPLRAVSPGRLQARLPQAGAGLYTFVLPTPQGPRRHLHLRRQHAEQQAWGLNPSLQDWAAQGLVRAWTPDFLERRGRSGPAPAGVDRSLVLLALLLSAAAVLVDRKAWGAAGLSAAWAALRARARRAASPAR